jgi:hypothetical protein
MVRSEKTFILEGGSPGSTFRVGKKISFPFSLCLKTHFSSWAGEREYVRVEGEEKEGEHLLDEESTGN